jgi:pimeloyl-ACP methyl ester carboxylesterase
MTMNLLLIRSEITVPTLSRSGQTIGLPGLLSLPERQRGLVLFAHGSGSSRLSPRNTFVARVLNESSLGTLLFDLLTEFEAADRGNVFDIELLADRLAAAIAWIARHDQTASLPLGLFGASTGAAAALVAATREPRVAAIVSRGGRPDLARHLLGRVDVPTLLIVGGQDEQVLALNRVAHAVMTCDKQLSIVPGATHLFEEPGTLDEAARLAAEWFVRHLHE